jgi:AcrR family transcriptional regulator
MSTTRSTAAREPKRQRGHLRVAAIMAAGVEIFTEKGYDAATMTEIATRSGTAIASLYRFFPSKEALADALLLQYAKHVLDGLAKLRQQAADLTLDGIATALVDFRLELLLHRKFAIGLADVRGAGSDQRTQFHHAMLDSMAGILLEVIPSLTREKSEAVAAILVHILKGVAVVHQEEPAARRLLLAEIEDLIRVYLNSVQLSATVQEGDKPLEATSPAAAAIPDPGCHV